MSNHSLRPKEFFIGAAVVGSLIGVAGALLLTPKKNHGLRRELADFYAKAGKQTSYWSDRAKSLLDDFNEGENAGHSKVFTIGALAGGVLGAAAGLLLAPKAGDEIRDDILDKYQEFSDRTQGFAKQFNRRGKKLSKSARSKTHRWLDLARNVIDDLLENGEELTDNLSDKVKNYTDVGHDRLSSVLDWASVGLKVWNSLNKRR